MKRLKKGLVSKSVSPETENEVVLRLTERGGAVFEQHRQYHEKLNKQLTVLLSEFPTDMIVCLKQLGIGIDQVLTNVIEEKMGSLERRTIHMK